MAGLQRAVAAGEFGRAMRLAITFEERRAIEAAAGAATASEAAASEAASSEAAARGGGQAASPQAAAVAALRAAPESVRWEALMEAHDAQLEGWRRLWKWGPPASCLPEERR